MIEYIHNAIKATAGEDITVAAKIYNADGFEVSSGCALRLYDKDNESMIIRVSGTKYTDKWQFTIPADITKDLRGKYWYCFCKDGERLCFAQPIYLV